MRALDPRGPVVPRCLLEPYLRHWPILNGLFLLLFQMGSKTMFHNHLSMNIALKCMAPLLRIPDIVGSHRDPEKGGLEGFCAFP